MFFRMVYKSGQIFLPFCHNSRVWQTDRRTDGRTEISSQYRVCITCSAVKTNLYSAIKYEDSEALDGGTSQLSSQREYGEIKIFWGGF